MESTIKIAIVDDHHLFRSGIINIIKNLNPKFDLFLEAQNGNELIQKFETESLPNLVFMDLNMPGMNGVELAKWLQKNHPQIPVLVLSMLDDEATMIKMLRLGVKGYLSKNIEPEELGEAIDSVLQKGHYYTDHITSKLLLQLANPYNSVQLNDKESHFLQLACSELTYKEIADMMCLSFKTIDGYRNAVFEKMNVKSRVGMVLYAMKLGLVNNQLEMNS